MQHRETHDVDDCRHGKAEPFAQPAQNKPPEIDLLHQRCDHRARDQQRKELRQVVWQQRLFCVSGFEVDVEILGDETQRRQDDEHDHDGRTDTGRKEAPRNGREIARERGWPALRQQKPGAEEGSSDRTVIRRPSRRSSFLDFRDDIADTGAQIETAGGTPSPPDGNAEQEQEERNSAR